jgi:hypothetical protein
MYDSPMFSYENQRFNQLFFRTYLRINFSNLIVNLIKKSEKAKLWRVNNTKSFVTSNQTFTTVIYRCIIDFDQHAHKNFGYE